ncbi:hypothetical protein OJ997_25025 [Solirubrobacter phytolaccae]|uniref:Uncharacterized protein n=1 Tax=Solirubrobacter phytolaccae TaxID=1404360 RepID=A0A9X3NGG3_9ACTN|nr:hypothetical protein [Solirubrobacter phytolaccae]MDA0183596.1 hypothetical protein [Solirubrobacter phytolaccae]
MVQPLTRIGIWILFWLAAANGIFLYLAPGLADTEYAWAIKPAVNAAFIGAGFLAGTLATGLVLWRAREWRTFSTLPIALWVLASSLALATFIHEDRFFWDYPLTWVWTAVYVGVPFAVPFLVWRQRRDAEAKPAASCKLKGLRITSAIVGAALLIGSVALFLFPADLLEHWPWTLTPLLARAVAAWYALFGTMLVSCAIGLRRPHEAFIPYATLTCWTVLLLALPLLHPDDVSAGGPWLALMLALLALGAYGVLRSAAGFFAART